ncbi:MAG: leucine-rich repeat protein, partial [Ruminococcus sp.]|nr:leucine-rich repeat protein [Ruminococcus sp.]
MKLKKLLIMFMLLASAKPVVSYSESISENIEYNGMIFNQHEVYADELILTEYTGNNEILVIPEHIGNYTVTAISDEVFKDNQNIKNVTLPDTINYFGSEVFRNSSLVSVNIPKSLRVIPDYSFNNCSELETVAFHDDIVIMNNTAFKKTDIEVPLKLYDKVTDSRIPTSNTSVFFEDNEWDYDIESNYGEYHARIRRYDGKDNVITVPDSINGVPITHIDPYAFGIEPDIKKISFPANIKDLGMPFNRWEFLEEITLPSDIDRIHNFADCTNLKKINFQGNPESFTIDYHAFTNCTSLDYIPYPESCRNIIIGDNAFENTDVRELKLDIDSSIGKDAFKDCNNLSYIELNNSDIDFRAFRNCSALEDATITGKSSIAEMVFYDCRNLKNITLSDFDIPIKNAVYDCPELMTINNKNVFDSKTSDFTKDMKEFILNNFRGSDDVGFLNMYVDSHTDKIINEIISENMSEVQKIKAVHDWICNNTVYDDGLSGGRNNHNDASVLLNDSTVCEGYARIANILYNKAGLETYYVSGVDHAWNVL